MFWCSLLSVFFVAIWSFTHTQHFCRAFVCSFFAVFFLLSVAHKVDIYFYNGRLKRKGACEYTVHCSWDRHTNTPIFYVITADMSKYYGASWKKIYAYVYKSSENESGTQLGKWFREWEGKLVKNWRRKKKGKRDCGTLLNRFFFFSWPACKKMGYMHLIHVISFQDPKNYTHKKKAWKERESPSFQPFSPLINGCCFW